MLGFAAIGLLLFYLGYRYNFIYVYQVPYDTKGLMYARALQQLFVGVYLAILCMIGLFAIKLTESSKLLGPLILMIIFLIFTILYHLSLNSALQPCLQYLPKTLETEERRLLAAEESEDDADVESNMGEIPPPPPPKGRYMESEAPQYERGLSNSGSSTVPLSEEKKLTSEPPAQWKPSAFMKWLRPDKYVDYYSLRKLVPRREFDITYDEGQERNAYFHPSVIDEPKVLWIPRDDAGVSAQEIRHTSKITPITDEGATLDARGSILWDEDNAEKVPIYERRVYW